MHAREASVADRPRILWGINVYSRLNHLRLQEALIRRHFGNRVDLFVFSNHERNGEAELRFMEDILHVHPVNSGAHTGCQDAYNEGLRHLRSDHRFVVWSHADCILSDYRFMDEVFELMDADDDAFAALQGVSHRSNPRTAGTFEGEVPYVLNDLMVFRPDLYRRTFPRHGVLDGPGSPYGVEVAMGIWVTDSLLPGEGVHVMGDRIVDHQSAEMLGSMEAAACMTNRFEKTADFVRSRIDPATVEWLDSQGLLTKAFDDVRPGWFD